MHIIITIYFHYLPTSGNLEPMGKPKGTHFIISAASTESGAPLYFVTGGTWTKELQSASTLETEAQRDEALGIAADQEAIVCDPYSFMVTVTDGVIDPLSARENIRANGPTVLVRRPDEGMGARS